MFFAGNWIFFFWNQLRFQIIMESVKPPIQMPVIVSSIPSQRENPTPAPTATTQTGQMAYTEKGKKARTKENGTILEKVFTVI